MRKPSRRDVLKGAGAAGLAVFASPIRAAAPPAEPITPALIEAARKEGKVVWYTSIDLSAAERVAKSFEAKFPGIPVRVERNGAERLFQRIGQEYSSNIYTVDVVNTSDASHVIPWKRNGWLAAYVPEDVAKHFPAEHKDPDGTYASARVTLCPIAYNTNLVKREEAPKSYADLLDPKWAGKIVKAHPGYSGTILTATYQIARDLGWSYFEKLAQQKIMQVQSATDPPKKLALGERAVQADGNDYSLMLYRDAGRPVEVVYASEGTPQIIVETGIFRSSANPNAARLFQHFLFSAEGQQIFIDFAHRSFHAQVKDKPGRPPLSAIRTLKSDPAAVEAQSDQIKARYTKIFGV